MKQKLTLLILALLTTIGMWAKTELEYTALTTGVDYVLMDNGKQCFLANGGKTSSISAANKYRIVDAGDGKYYLMQTSTSQYVATESNGATVTWTSDQASAEKFTINKQDNNTRVRFISSTNSSYFLNSQGSDASCPKWTNGPDDWSYWYVYEYDDFFVPTANKGYKLKMKGTDLYVKFLISGYTETSAVNATSLASEGSIFKIESNGLTNTMKWQNEYVKTQSTYYWNSSHGTDATHSKWYIEPVDGESNTYYIKATDPKYSGSEFFGNDTETPAADQYLYTDQTSGKRNIKWVLEETTNVARMQENGFGPETSTAGSPKYYTIKNTRANKYAKYAGDAAKMDLVSDRLGSTANAFWFEAVDEGGLPDDVLAVKIHNVAAGKCVAATNSFTTGGITWYIKADVYTGTTSVAINSSSTVWNNNSYGWNNESGSNLKIANWASTDIGSAWWIEALSDADYTTLSKDYTSDVTTNIQPYIDAKGDGYFKLNNTNATSLSGMITAASEGGITHEEYGELNNQLYNNLLTFPATGYYRIKSSGSRAAGETYITYGYCSDKSKYGLVTTPVANKYTDAGTVFKFTRVGATGGVYKLSTQGLNVQDENGYNTPFTVTSAEAVDFVFETISPGVVAIRHNTGDGYAYLHESGWASPSGVVRWDKESAASQWTVQNAESVTVGMHGDGASPTQTYYATLYLPFDVTISGADAFTLAKSGSYLVPTAVTDNKVPAGTPVLVKGTSATATAAINTSDAFSAIGTGDLTGTYVDLSVTAETDYFLGKDGITVGFYKWNGTTLKANRAYLAKATAEAAVKGFVLMFDDDDATGINSLTLALSEGEGAIYNLAGQRVSKMQKGINIVNGKKILK